MSTQEPDAALSPSERAPMRELLAARRDSTMARIASLQREFDGVVESSAGESTDDEHDPEGATIAFERAQISTLLSQARSHLDDLDRALERLHAGTYGTCEGCRQAIAYERLAARPTATRCMTCASVDSSTSPSTRGH